MNNNFNTVIFGSKTFSGILKDVYDNSKKTEKQISDLIISLKDHITGPGDAQILVPLIVQYLEVKVKNDEHLVKMAAIVQRAISNSGTSSNGDVFLPEEELNALIEQAKLLESSSVSSQKQLDVVNTNKKNNE